MEEKRIIYNLVYFKDLPNYKGIKEQQIFPIMLSERRKVAIMVNRRQLVEAIVNALINEELASKIESKELDLQPMELLQYIANMYQQLMEKEEIQVKEAKK